MPFRVSSLGLNVIFRAVVPSGRSAFSDALPLASSEPEASSNLL